MYLSFSLIKIHPCYWFKFAKKILKEKQTYIRGVFWAMSNRFSVKSECRQELKQYSTIKNPLRIDSV